MTQTPADPSQQARDPVTTLAEDMSMVDDNTPAPADAEASFRGPLNAALERMKRASDRRTGCHLTAQMIEALSVSIIGDIWEQPSDEQ